MPGEARTRATGRCLCGAVRYEIRGPLRDVVLCHCSECRRWHGHVCAATAALAADVVLTSRRGLRWIDSPASRTHARRGFCGECGSSLFWAAPGRDTLSIAAGTLDAPTGLKTVAQINLAAAGDYYEPDRELRGFPAAADAATAAVPPRPPTPRT